MAITLSHDHPKNLNMSNVNAREFFFMLELPCDEGCYGEADIHTVRRAIIKANALFGRRKLTQVRRQYLSLRLKDFSSTVETLAGMGATVIYWA